MGVDSQQEGLIVNKKVYSWQEGCDSQYEGLIVSRRGLVVCRRV